MTETGSFEEIKITWEMFEGSLALTQVGIFWKEYSRKATDQISGTAGGAKTLEVMRLRRAWHLPYYSATGPYDDEEDGNEEEEESSEEGSSEEEESSEDEDAELGSEPSEASAKAGAASVQFGGKKKFTALHLELSQGALAQYKLQVQQLVMQQQQAALQCDPVTLGMAMQQQQLLTVERDRQQQQACLTMHKMRQQDAMLQQEQGRITDRMRQLERAAAHGTNGAELMQGVIAGGMLVQPSQQQQRPPPLRSPQARTSAPLPRTPSPHRRTTPP